MTRSSIRAWLAASVGFAALATALIAPAPRADAQQPAVRPVRYFVPDGLTGGTANKEPFAAGTEIRFQQTIDPGRLPRLGGALTDIYLIPSQSGRIDVTDVTITIGHGTSLAPLAKFDANLNNFVVAYRGPIRAMAQANRAFRIELNTIFPYDGTSPLVIDLKLRGIQSGPSVYRAPRGVRAIFAKGAGAYGAEQATSGVVAGVKVGVDFAAVEPTVQCLTDPDVGSKLQLAFQASSRIGDAFTAGAAFSSAPGIDIGEYTIPLAPDALFFSVWGLPGMFQNFTGQVGLAGFGSGAVNIPNEPALVGTSFVLAFVTHTPSSGITSVSMESWVTIGTNCAP